MQEERADGLACLGLGGGLRERGDCQAMVLPRCQGDMLR